ncbi:MAG TPA: hypothetical protein VE056_05620 [Pyrinomonadaceae bacterium]|nr:hypothetical protein [Pyrinomonadaceae bacterium]
MSMKVFRFSSFLFVVFLVISAAGFDFLVLAQESTNQNAAAATSTKKSTRRRGRRHKAANTNTATDAAVPLATADMPAAPAAETTEQTDLSGTYTGTFDCGDAGVSGPTTLTITGNQFTTDGGKSGRIVASTTRGYTGVAMQFGEVVMSTPGHPAGPPPTIVSMRAKKSGDRLTLTTVPGASHVCSFTPTGASGRSRHRRSRAAATPAMPAEPAMPAATETPATAAEPATPAKPSRGRGRRGNRKTNMNTNTTTNDNTGTTEGTMGATPTPTPAVPRN